MPAAAHTRPLLVVDDERDIRESFRDLLSGAGYVVHTAEHGEDALAKLRGPGQPALVLLDLMMPVMDGLDFYLALRERDPALFAATRFLVVSAAGELPLEMRTARVPWLAKPFEVRTLLEWVARDAAA